ARMLFYMDVMYDDLTLVDGAPGDGAYEMGDLDSLLEWHVTDDVSGFEERRNDVIASYQDNRNPFIDHPHLAYLVYYDHPEVGLD
ncbi:MAG: endonuclease, partial [Bacillota bacterium]